jgi:hypothetical protein
MRVKVGFWVWVGGVVVVGVRVIVGVKVMVGVWVVVGVFVGVVVWVDVGVDEGVGLGVIVAGLDVGTTSVRIVGCGVRVGRVRVEQAISDKRSKASIIFVMGVISNISQPVGGVPG